MHRSARQLASVAASVHKHAHTFSLTQRPTFPGLTRLMSAAAGEGGPVYKAIVSKLQAELAPTEMELLDDSASHSGHSGMKGKEAVESHFKLRVVSDKFEGLPLVQRHQLVYGLLTKEFEAGLHALNIKAKTPKEMAK